MRYIAVNASNNYDESNKTRYATQEEADARARDILGLAPSAQVFVAQVLKEYSAHVSIIAKDPLEPASDLQPPVDESAA
ncbi:hypothetical protein [Pseudomonas cremoricolorata]|uniref:Prophage PssSM-02 n=1 Tax=Pseudomonas cremoricolorata TaxID=157783 RepID=A0A089WNA7_9PSED|nr:hypothetical protein [Pseudomonas cremoricolorata]AIR90765.1 prophage PssSM-02 [Pseudomonas cremoricolorata]